MTCSILKLATSPKMPQNCSLTMTAIVVSSNPVLPLATFNFLSLSTLSFKETFTMKTKTRKTVRKTDDFDDFQVMATHLQELLFEIKTALPVLRTMHDAGELEKKMRRAVTAAEDALETEIDVRSMWNETV